MKKLFLVSSALVTLWSQGAIAGKGAFECHVTGWMYEEGCNGTPKNPHTAYSHYEKADKKGHRNAKKSMKRVLDQMTPEQRAMYNPNRAVQVLEPELWRQIIAQSESLGAFSQVSKPFNTILQDETIWPLLAQHYNVGEKQDIPLKELVEVDHYMKKAFFARVDEKYDLQDALLNRATKVGDGRAFWFSIPNLLYWDLVLRGLSGCKDMIEAQVAQGNFEAVVRKHQGLTSGWYGYEESLEGAHNLRKELETQGNLDAFNKRRDEIRRGEILEKILNRFPALSESIGHFLFLNPKILDRLKRTLPFNELLRQDVSDDIKGLLPPILPIIK